MEIWFFSILLAITNLRDLIARYARCALRLLVVSSDPYLWCLFRNKLGNPLQQSATKDPNLAVIPSSMMAEASPSNDSQ